jgi:hypothetical protein
MFEVLLMKNTIIFRNDAMTISLSLKEIPESRRCEFLKILIDNYPYDYRQVEELLLKQFPSESPTPGPTDSIPARRRNQNKRKNRNRNKSRRQILIDNYPYDDRQVEELLPKQFPSESPAPGPSDSIPARRRNQNKRKNRNRNK